MQNHSFVEPAGRVLPARRRAQGSAQWLGASRGAFVEAGGSSFGGRAARRPRRRWWPGALAVQERSASDLAQILLLTPGGLSCCR